MQAIIISVPQLYIKYFNVHYVGMLVSVKKKIHLFIPVLHNEICIYVLFYFKNKSSYEYLDLRHHSKPCDLQI